MRKLVLVLTLTSLMILLVSSAAFAASHFANPGDRTKTITATNCIECHANSEKHTTGPHGGYANATDKCATCHDIHAGAENPQLLMGLTLTAACNYCHDLTQTNSGPYSMTVNEGETYTSAAAHRVVGINVGSYTDTEGHFNSTLYDEGIDIIPGGSLDGSEGILDTAGQGKLSGSQFTCNSCHTPHGTNTVQPYLGETQVKYSAANLPAGVTGKIFLTNRILKSKPNGALSPVSQYGSAWCASCHKGRDNNIQDKHNHPVDENAPAYNVLELAQANGMFNDPSQTVADVIADGVVTIGSGLNAEVSADPRTNQPYAMTEFDELNPDGPVTRPNGYVAIAASPDGPACQQCHAGARDVDLAFAAGSNPRSGSFPHISTNKGLLIESKDDFCTNCHAPSVLP